MKRIFPIFNAVIAIAAGVIVLLGYFIDTFWLKEMRIVILSIAALLAGWAVLIGVGNLLSVHLNKIREQKTGRLNSLVLLVFFLMTVVLVIIPGDNVELKQFQGIFLNGIMVPAEISLMAILSVTLLYAAIRMLRWRSDWKAILFLVVALLLLAIVGPWPVIGQLLSSQDRGFVEAVLVTGGARGILIGVALGTLTTGLRILFGADRPYGGK